MGDKIHRIRAPHKVHILSWVLSLERSGTVPCHFKNCKFMAITVEEMAQHYAHCKRENTLHPFICGTCGQCTDTPEKLTYHKIHNHSYKANDLELSYLAGFFSAIEKKEVTPILKRAWQIFLENRRYLKCFQRDCLYVPESLEEMEEHYLNHCKGTFWKDLKFTCQLCHGRFYAESKLRSHIKNAHNTSELRNVPVCKPGLSKAELHEVWARSIVDNKQAKCPVEQCRFVCNSISGLEKHYKNCNGQKKDFLTCPTCNLWLLNQEKLTEHRKCIHKDDSDTIFLKCEVIDESAESIDLSSNTNCELSNGSIKVEEEEEPEIDDFPSPSLNGVSTTGSKLRKYLRAAKSENNICQSPRPEVLLNNNTRSIDWVRSVDVSRIQYAEDIVDTNSLTLDIVNVNTSNFGKILNEGVMEGSQGGDKAGSALSRGKQRLPQSHRKSENNVMPTPLEMVAYEVMQDSTNQSTVPVQIKVENVDFTVDVPEKMIIPTSSKDNFPLDQKSLGKMLRKESLRLLEISAKKTSIRADIKRVVDFSHKQVVPFKVSVKSTQKKTCSNSNNLASNVKTDNERPVVILNEKNLGNDNGRTAESEGIEQNSLMNGLCVPKIEDFENTSDSGTPSQERGVVNLNFIQLNEGTSYENLESPNYESGEKDPLSLSVENDSTVFIKSRSYNFYNEDSHGESTPEKDSDSDFDETLEQFGSSSSENCDTDSNSSSESENDSDESDTAVDPLGSLNYNYDRGNSNEVSEPYALECIQPWNAIRIKEEIQDNDCEWNDLEMIDKDHKSSIQAVSNNDLDSSINQSIPNSAQENQDPICNQTKDDLNSVSVTSYERFFDRSNVSKNGSSIEIKSEIECTLGAENPASVDHSEASISDGSIVIGIPENICIQEEEEKPCSNLPTLKDGAQQIEHSLDSTVKDENIDSVNDNFVNSNCNDEDSFLKERDIKTEDLDFVDSLLINKVSVERRSIKRSKSLPTPSESEKVTQENKALFKGFTSDTLSKYKSKYNKVMSFYKKFWHSDSVLSSQENHRTFGVKSRKDDGYGWNRSQSMVSLENLHFFNNKITFETLPSPSQISVKVESSNFVEAENKCKSDVIDTPKTISLIEDRPDTSTPDPVTKTEYDTQSEETYLVIPVPSLHDSVIENEVSSSKSAESYVISNEGDINVKEEQGEVLCEDSNVLPADIISLSEEQIMKKKELVGVNSSMGLNGSLTRFNESNVNNQLIQMKVATLSDLSAATDLSDSSMTGNHQGKPLEALGKENIIIEEDETKGDKGNKYLLPPVLQDTEFNPDEALSLPSLENVEGGNSNKIGQSKLSPIHSQGNVPIRNTCSADAENIHLAKPIRVYRGSKKFLPVNLSSGDIVSKETLPMETIDVKNSSEATISHIHELFSDIDDYSSAEGDLNNFFEDVVDSSIINKSVLLKKSPDNHSNVLHDNKNDLIGKENSSKKSISDSNVFIASAVPRQYTNRKFSYQNNKNIGLHESSFSLKTENRAHECRPVDHKISNSEGIGLFTAKKIVESSSNYSSLSNRNIESKENVSKRPDLGIELVIRNESPHLIEDESFLMVFNESLLDNHENNVDDENSEDHNAGSIITFNDINTYEKTYLDFYPCAVTSTPVKLKSSRYNRNNPLDIECNSTDLSVSESQTHQPIHSTDPEKINYFGNNNCKDNSNYSNVKSRPYKDGRSTSVGGQKQKDSKSFSKVDKELEKILPPTRPGRRSRPPKGYYKKICTFNEVSAAVATHNMHLASRLCEGLQKHSPLLEKKVLPKISSFKHVGKIRRNKSDSDIHITNSEVDKETVVPEAHSSDLETPLLSKSVGNKVIPDFPRKVAYRRKSENVFSSHCFSQCSEEHALTNQDVFQSTTEKNGIKSQLSFKPSGQSITELIKASGLRSCLPLSSSENNSHNSFPNDRFVFRNEGKSTVDSYKGFVKPTKKSSVLIDIGTDKDAEFEERSLKEERNSQDPSKAFSGKCNVNNEISVVKCCISHNLNYIPCNGVPSFSDKTPNDKMEGNPIKNIDKSGCQQENNESSVFCCQLPRRDVTESYISERHNIEEISLPLKVESSASKASYDNMLFEESIDGGGSSDNEGGGQLDSVAESDEEYILGTQSLVSISYHSESGVKLKSEVVNESDEKNASLRLKTLNSLLPKTPESDSSILLKRRRGRPRKQLSGSDLLLNTLKSNGLCSLQPTSDNITQVPVEELKKNLKRSELLGSEDSERLEQVRPSLMENPPPPRKRGRPRKSLDAPLELNKTNHFGTLNISKDFPEESSRFENFVNNGDPKDDLIKRERLRKCLDDCKGEYVVSPNNEERVNEIEISKCPNATISLTKSSLLMDDMRSPPRKRGRPKKSVDSPKSVSSPEIRISLKEGATQITPSFVSTVLKENSIEDTPKLLEGSQELKIVSLCGKSLEEEIEGNNPLPIIQGRKSKNLVVAEKIVNNTESEQESVQPSSTNLVDLGEKRGVSEASDTSINEKSIENTIAIQDASQAPKKRGRPRKSLNVFDKSVNKSEFTNSDNVTNNPEKQNIELPNSNLVVSEKTICGSQFDDIALKKEIIENTSLVESTNLPKKRGRPRKSSNAFEKSLQNPKSDTSSKVEGLDKNSSIGEFSLVQKNVELPNRDLVVSEKIVAASESCDTSLHKVKKENNSLIEDKDISPKNLGCPKSNLEVSEKCSLKIESDNSIKQSNETSLGGDINNLQKSMDQQNMGLICKNGMSASESDDKSLKAETMKNAPLIDNVSFGEFNLSQKSIEQPNTSLVIADKTQGSLESQDSLLKEENGRNTSLTEDTALLPKKRGRPRKSADGSVKNIHKPVYDISNKEADNMPFIGEVLQESSVIPLMDSVVSGDVMGCSESFDTSHKEQNGKNTTQIKEALVVPKKRGRPRKSMDFAGKSLHNPEPDNSYRGSNDALSIEEPCLLQKSADAPNTSMVVSEKFKSEGSLECDVNTSVKEEIGGNISSIEESSLVPKKRGRPRKSMDVSEKSLHSSEPDNFCKGSNNALSIGEPCLLQKNTGAPNTNLVDSERNKSEGGLECDDSTSVKEEIGGNTSLIEVTSLVPKKRGRPKKSSFDQPLLQPESDISIKGKFDVSSIGGILEKSSELSNTSNVVLENVIGSPESYDASHMEENRINNPIIDDPKVVPKKRGRPRKSMEVSDKSLHNVEPDNSLKGTNSALFTEEPCLLQKSPKLSNSNLVVSEKIKGKNDSLVVEEKDRSVSDSKCDDTFVNDKNTGNTSFIDDSSCVPKKRGRPRKSMNVSEKSVQMVETDILMKGADDTSFNGEFNLLQRGKGAHNALDIPNFNIPQISSELLNSSLDKSIDMSESDNSIIEKGNQNTSCSDGYTLLPKKRGRPRKSLDVSGKSSYINESNKSNSKGEGVENILSIENVNTLPKKQRFLDKLLDVPESNKSPNREDTESTSFVGDVVKTLPKKRGRPRKCPNAPESVVGTPASDMSFKETEDTLTERRTNNELSNYSETLLDTSGNDESYFHENSFIDSSASNKNGTDTPVVFKRRPGRPRKGEKYMRSFNLSSSSIIDSPSFTPHSEIEGRLYRKRQVKDSTDPGIALNSYDSDESFEVKRKRRVGAKKKWEDYELADGEPLAVQTNWRRKDLGDRIYAGSFLKNPNAKVTCAVCKKTMTCMEYKKFHLPEHNFVAWLEGEEPLPVDDMKAMLVILNRGKKHFPKHIFKCQTCSVAKRSAMGYISHLQMCGKSASEREKMLVSCDHCGRLMMPSSLMSHYYQSHAQPKEVPPLAIEETDTTRKAALKCLGKIADYAQAEGVKGKKSSDDALDSNDNDDEEVDEDRELSLLYAPVKRRPSKHMKNRWKLQEKGGQLLKCNIPSCGFSCLSYNEMISHVKSCEFTFRGFSCIKCNFVSGNENEMRDHVKMCNPPIALSRSDSSDSDEHDKTTSISYLKTEELKHNYSRINKCHFFKPALGWMKAISKTHFSRDSLYPELSNSTEYWEGMSVEESEKYKPETRKSLKVNFASSHMEEMDLFEGKVSEGGEGIGFCGGPIWGMAWCPGDGEQFLATSPHESMESIFQIGSTYTGPGMIQFWSLGNINNTKESKIELMKFSFGICHEEKGVWDLAWCPSGGRTEDRLGLLVLATVSGSLPIYAVPHPAILPLETSRFFKPEPVLKLEVNSNERWQCSAITWSQIKPHRIIAGGFVNGIIAVWDLSIQSKLLRPSPKVLHPFKIFQAHNSFITGLCLSPENEEYLASSSFDKSFKFWDLRDTTSPQSVTKRGLFTGTEWLRHWMMAVTTYDVAYSMAQTTVSLSPIREFMQPGMQVLTTTNSTSWSVSTNDWLNCIASSSDNGQAIIIFALKHVVCHYKDKKKYSKVIVQSNLEDLVKTECDASTSSQSENTAEGIDNSSFIGYDSASKKFGLKINLDPLVREFGATDLLQESTSEGRIDVYPLNSINKIAWNRNEQSFCYLAMGYQSGFLVALRLSLPHLDQSYIDSILSTKQDEGSNDPDVT